MPAVGGSSASLFDFDLVAFLSDKLQMPVYAPLRSGNKYRAPVNVGGTGPIVNYRRVSAFRDYLLGGSSGVVEANYQIDVFAELMDDVIVVGEQLRVILNDFSGMMGGTEVLTCNLANQMEGWIENEDPKLVGMYRLISEFTFVYRESTSLYL